ncbi:hypothetical protein PG990_011857 [Apiospora arundinis]
MYKMDAFHFPPSYDRRYGGSLRDSPNNLMSYNETGSIAWPIAVVQEQDPRPNGNGLLDGPSAKLSCIIASMASSRASAPGKPSTAGDQSNGSIATPVGVGHILLVSAVAILVMSVLD